MLLLVSQWKQNLPEENLFMEGYMFHRQYLVFSVLPFVWKQKPNRRHLTFCCCRDDLNSFSVLLQTNGSRSLLRGSHCPSYSIKHSSGQTFPTCTVCTLLSNLYSYMLPTTFIFQFGINCHLYLYYTNLFFPKKKAYIYKLHI